MPDIVIREMNENDAEQVFNIEKAAFGRPWTREALLASAMREDTVFIVAKTGGEIAGYACAYVSFDEAELVRIATAADKRRQGLGETVLLEMEKAAKERGADVIILEVRQSNEAARRMYEKNGYENIGIRKNFYDFPKEDAVIMRKEGRC